MCIALRIPEGMSNGCEVFDDCTVSGESSARVFYIFAIVAATNSVSPKSLRRAHPRTASSANRFCGDHVFGYNELDTPKH